MARVRTIAELDDVIGSTDVARRVPILPLETGGVDPLGLPTGTGARTERTTRLLDLP